MTLEESEEPYKPYKIRYMSYSEELFKIGIGALAFLGGSALFATAGFAADYGFDYHVVGDVLKVAGSVGAGASGLASLVVVASVDVVDSPNRFGSLRKH